MAQTQIEWTWRRHPDTGILYPGYTMNFWIGCTPVSEECSACYAWAQDTFRHWTSDGWGKGKPRHRTSDHNWRQPIKWNKDAKEAGIALAVFTNSLADFFDKEVDPVLRNEAMQMIALCENLDWLVLTKRADAAREYLTDIAEGMGGPLPNIYAGATMGCKKSVLERADDLINTPAVVRFISVEPLLEDIGEELLPYIESGKIHWVIVGGESEQKPLGRKARPMHPDWILKIQTACWANNVRFFFKQWGHWAPAYALGHNPQLQAMCLAGKVPVHQFSTGEAGRSTVFAAGKLQGGCELDGAIVHEIPTVRRV